MDRYIDTAYGLVVSDFSKLLNRCYFEIIASMTTCIRLINNITTVLKESTFIQYDTTENTIKPANKMHQV